MTKYAMANVVNDVPWQGREGAARCGLAYSGAWCSRCAVGWFQETVARCSICTRHAPLQGAAALAVLWAVVTVAGVRRDNRRVSDVFGGLLFATTSLSMAGTLGPQVISYTL